jgi:hypothetical protein
LSRPNQDLESVYPALEGSVFFSQGLVAFFEMGDVFRGFGEDGCLFVLVSFYPLEKSKPERCLASSTFERSEAGGLGLAPQKHTK